MTADIEEEEETKETKEKETKKAKAKKIRNYRDRDGYFPQSYFNTLSNEDYLLKMITTNTEINPLFPFKIKSSDNFMARLPEKLRAGLKLVNINKTAHRFWIDTKDLNY